MGKIEAIGRDARASTFKVFEVPAARSSTTILRTTRQASPSASTIRQAR